jgi:predicted 3-demethylubiquinone-9 3-methyltransferase (glyoxalase superfamily)
MQKITTFLWFDRNAEEAMNSYVSVFKNSKILRVSRYGDAGPGPKGTVMAATFQLEGQELIIPTLLPKLLSDKDPKKTSRVMKAMLQMKKIDSKKLQQAYDQA